MSETTKPFFVALALGFFGALGLALWLIGGDRLFVLALIVLGGAVIAGVVAASALPIRAARKRDMTGETHHYHDGTRTIIRERVLDGRQAAAPEVKLLQLPQQQAGGAFPELLRAAYVAGVLGNPRTAKPDGASEPAEELAEIDLSGDEWGGEIRP